MEGLASVVLVCLSLIMVAPTSSMAGRTCFCSAWIDYPPTGADRLLQDVRDTIYGGWFASCSRARGACPNDCKRSALSALGGNANSFTTAAGDKACSVHGGDDISDPGFSVVAKYSPSNCGQDGQHLLAEHVCCASRCTCKLMSKYNNGVKKTLSSVLKQNPNPFYKCHEEGTVQNSCKNLCMNHFTSLLKGRIYPSYDTTSSSELCRRLNTQINAPGAEVYMEYTSGGVTKTLGLQRMCCFKIPNIPTVFPNPACVNIPF